MLRVYTIHKIYITSTSYITSLIFVFVILYIYVHILLVKHITKHFWKEAISIATFCQMCQSKVLLVNIAVAPLAQGRIIFSTESS